MSPSLHIWNDNFTSVPPCFWFQAGTVSSAGGSFAKKEKAEEARFIKKMEAEQAEKKKKKDAEKKKDD